MERPNISEVKGIVFAMTFSAMECIYIIKRDIEMPSLRKLLCSSFTSIILSFLLYSSACAIDRSPSEGFPGRALFSTIPVMEMSSMYARLNDIRVVDVRSRYEYEILHIKGAKHISLQSKTFIEEVRELQAGQGKPVVFYCNGRACYKSYEAVDKAKSSGIKNVYAFDAGVFDWARTHPAHSVLLGTSPIDPQRLIDERLFEAHLLEPAMFAERANADRGALIVDIRDYSQSGATSLFVARQESLVISDLAAIDAILGRAKSAGLPLFIYDEAGQQVRWFQYYLENARVREYYFMKGGAKAFYRQVLMSYPKTNR